MVSVDVKHHVYLLTRSRKPKVEHDGALSPHEWLTDFARFCARLEISSGSGASSTRRSSGENIK